MCIGGEMNKIKMRKLLNDISLFCDGKMMSDDEYVDKEEKEYYRKIKEQAEKYLEMLEGRTSKEVKQEIEDFINNHNYWDI
jgi:hypothetical protein